MTSLWQTPPYIQPDSFDEIGFHIGPPDLAVPATLTLPQTPGQHACIVMLSGSGPTDRDSTVQSAKPFKDLAWGLASRGIASIRFDKVTLTHSAKIRGEGLAEFTLADEYQTHALAAVRSAIARDDVRSGAVFVLGHSLGAFVTPRVVAAEPAVAGCILLATPSRAFYWAAVRQLGYLANLGLLPPGSEDELGSQLADLQRRCELADRPDLAVSTPSSELPFGIGAAYWIDLHDCKPVERCLEMKKPVLLLQGGRDYQVSAEDDYVPWMKRLAGKQDATCRLYPDLNHLFIAGEGQSTPLEYNTPGNVDEGLIGDIADWIGRAEVQGQSIY